MKHPISILLLIFFIHDAFSQQIASPTPPMGFMTWNYFKDNLTENDVRTIADALVSTGLRDLGFNHIFIDDGWQGGRDNRNNLIPDPVKFPSGMKTLSDYVHSQGLKLGIYSDGAPLTCAGYTGSLHFEDQDARTFAQWGIDYLKYDYCNAPSDRETAIARYAKMAKALKSCGREIILGICEWGDREPWLWAGKAGGQLWRTTADVRDKWRSKTKPETPADLHHLGAGIFDIMNVNASLNKFAGPGGWNDADMLVVGLNGKEGPSGDLGGTGCSDIEYQSQMSLWCLMAAPLMISCDIRNMNTTTKMILTNKDIIDINQDSRGIQAQRYIIDNCHIFTNHLSNVDIAIGILNASDSTLIFSMDKIYSEFPDMKFAFDVWKKERLPVQKNRKVSIVPHETKVYRLSAK